MQRQGKNFVEALCEDLRGLQTERIRLKQQKYIEANQEAIQKQRNAKRSLIELQEPNLVNRRFLASKENSFINPWDSEQKIQEEEQDQIITRQVRPHTHAVRRRQMKPQINDTQNLIPQLKNLLRRLQSPQKRREHECFDAQNFAIQLRRDLSSRRKHTVKVGDLLKLQQNNWISCPMRDPDRPLRSAQQRLNLNPPASRTQHLLTTQRNSCNRFESVHEQEVVQLIRRKRIEQSAKKQTSSGSVISATIIKKPSKDKDKDKRPRQKLTLIELLQ